MTRKYRSDIFNNNYYDDWTPQEISLKRNYDIKMLIKETKIPTQGPMLQQSLNALRDKVNLEQIQSNKVKTKHLLMHRPKTQGLQLITVGENKFYKTFSQKELKESQRSITTPDKNWPQQFFKSSQASASQSSLRNTESRQFRSSSKLSVNKIDQIMHLKKGYALSIKAPQVQVTKNSIFQSKLNSDLQSVVPDEVQGDMPPSAYSTYRLQGTLEIREPKFCQSQLSNYPRFESDNGSQVQLQQKQLQLKLDQQNKGRATASMISSRPTVVKIQIIASHKKQQKSIPNENANQNSQESLKDSSLNYSPEQKKQRDLILNARRKSFDTTPQNNSQIDVDQFLRLSRDNTIDNGHKSQTLDDYLQQFKEEKNRVTESDKNITIENQDVKQNQKTEKKFLSGNDELFWNCFQCTTLPSPPNIPMSESLKIKSHSDRERYYKMATEIVKIQKIIQNDPQNQSYYAKVFLKKMLNQQNITDEQVSFFKEFLNKYNLPPYIPNYNLKDFLWLIIDNKFEEVLRFTEMNQRDQSPFSQQKLFSQTSEAHLQEILNKTRKQMDSQTSFQQKILSFKQGLNDNFSRFKFQTTQPLSMIQGYTDQEQIKQKLSEEAKVEKKTRQMSMDAIPMIQTSHVNRFGQGKKSAVFIQQNKNIQINNQKQQPNNTEQNHLNIESLMLKRIEEKEQEENHAKVVSGENYSVQWNSRKFYWRNNPQMQKSMSHFNFFYGQTNNNHKGKILK